MASNSFISARTIDQQSPIPSSINPPTKAPTADAKSTRSNVLTSLISEMRLVKAELMEVRQQVDQQHVSSNQIVKNYDASTHNLLTIFEQRLEQATCAQAERIQEIETRLTRMEGAMHLSGDSAPKEPRGLIAENQRLEEESLDVHRALKALRQKYDDQVRQLSEIKSENSGVSMAAKTMTKQ